MDAVILGSIIQAVATIIAAVLATFIAVTQISRRQNEISNNEYGYLLDERQDLLLRLADDEYSRKWLLKHLKIEGVAQDQEFFYCLTCLQISHYQNVFLKYRNKQFPEELWPQWRNSMRDSFKTEEFKKILNSDFGKLLDPKFRTAIENDFPR